MDIGTRIDSSLFHWPFRLSRSSMLSNAGFIFLISCMALYTCSGTRAFVIYLSSLNIFLNYILVKLTFTCLIHVNSPFVKRFTLLETLSTTITNNNVLWRIFSHLTLLYVIRPSDILTVTYSVSLVLCTIYWLAIIIHNTFLCQRTLQKGNVSY